MVSATSLITLYVGLELQSLAGLRARLLPPHRRALGRGGPQIFRARRARQRHPALRHLAALRLHRHDELHRHRRRVRAAERRRSGCCSAWSSCSPASPSRSARCRSTCGRPTSTKARRRRSPPSSPRRPRSPPCCSATRVCLDALGPATDAWRQIVIFAALASIFLGAVAAYGQTNIKRLLAYSSINNVGFALIGLAAGGAAGRLVGAVLHGGLCRDDAGRVPLRAVDARRGRRAGRGHRQPVRPVADAAGASPRRFAIFMFSLAGIPPLVRLLAQAAGVPGGGAAGLIALAVAGILGTVVGAYYYLRIVKVMYLDEPARALCARARSRCRALLIFARRRCRLAARLSADRPARRAHRPRRGVDLLSRIRIVERTGSTNADLLADDRAVEGDWLVALAAGRGQGPPGPAVGQRERQFLRQHAGRAAARRSAAAVAVAGRRSRADRSGRRRGARPAADAQMAQRPDARSARSSAGILLERSGDRVVARLRGQSRRARRRSPDRRSRRPRRRDRAAGLRAAARRRASPGCSRCGGRANARRSPAPGWSARIRSGTPLTVHAGKDETVERPLRRARAGRRACG